MPELTQKLEADGVGHDHSHRQTTPDHNHTGQVKPILVVGKKVIIVHWRDGEGSIQEGHEALAVTHHGAVDSPRDRAGRVAQLRKYWIILLKLLLQIKGKCYKCISSDFFCNSPPHTSQFKLTKKVTFHQVIPSQLSLQLTDDTILKHFSDHAIGCQTS